MTPVSFSTPALRFFVRLALLLALSWGSVAQAGDWWDGAWTARQKITIDTSAKEAALTPPIGSPVVLVRLHDGNFKFERARENGSDLRFVAEDGKTLLPFHLERFDSLLHEAFAWVRVPELKPGAKTVLWLYYGAENPSPAGAPESGATYDEETALVYHFGEHGGAPADATKGHHTAETPGIPVEGSIIGGGVRFTGSTPLVIPAGPGLEWSAAGTASFSAWVKLTAPTTTAILFSRREETRAVVVGFDAGAPYLEVTAAPGAAQRTPALAALPPATWHHLASVAEAGKFTLYVDGEPAATLSAELPPLSGPLTLGGEAGAEGTGLPGDVDEVQLSRGARSPGSLKFAALNQGTEKGGSLLVSLADEEEAGGHGSGGHSGYFGVIVRSLTVDGWVVIALLAVMAAISWWVMLGKVAYLNGLAKGNALFMREWRHLATDLTALDLGEAEAVKSLGGRMSGPAQRSLRNSSVYRIYHLGAEEIRHRLAVDDSRSLSGRSIQAIRAALDSGLIREKQRIDRSIVLLTICISGGPFLGLLGTVVGVMITFAAVAAAGDVNVNAIAPGIAAALLATVAGLAVAIPALFGYNYILSRVKDATADMHVFIDEFVTKMAEFYTGANESRPPATAAHAAAMETVLELLQRALRSMVPAPASASPGGNGGGLTPAPALAQVP